MTSSALMKVFKTASTTPLEAAKKPPALNSALASALASREKRSIRRRLPPPTPIPSISVDSPVDFTSNDYLSLASSTRLRKRLLEKLASSDEVLGSCGSRLLVNPSTHVNLERRLERFFGENRGKEAVEEAEAEGDDPLWSALLFNSGYDANVGFFTSIPQPGDVVILDEYIHASVHDGVRASRVSKDSVLTFRHNSLDALRETLLQLLEANDERSTRLRDGSNSLFLAVESLYSMDGTLAPLREMSDMLEELFPNDNTYMIVDEAHATGIYGTEERPGRGRVAMVGLDGASGQSKGRVIARLHTFGKALGSSGAVILTTPLIRDYLINYARSLIYTTSLTHANVIAIGCSFDMVEDGTAAELSKHLLSLSAYLLNLLYSTLKSEQIPPELVALPPHLLKHLSSHHLTSSSSTTSPLSPIIPLLTPQPRPLSAYLLSKHNLNARPISWPTVPKGADRVRVCLHAANTRQDVESLVRGVVEWCKEREKETLKTKL
ncbi:PLP-dependent transferase [Dendrothele bispora CBS 962.96]|uniref:PLP-dependent transferase n=1 Tax=Dendrothele bispora (strain CBS 962.96) TaxID=1314807 RepID=A0A4S8MF11_DENBC|nr:PLP-dependent transferase [Dendrothele bispora CBS 962.96]